MHVTSYKEKIKFRCTVKFDFYFFEVRVIRTRTTIAVPDMQSNIIITLNKSPLIGESSGEAEGSLGISTVSDDASIGVAIINKTRTSINAEKTRFKSPNSSPVHF